MTQRDTAGALKWYADHQTKARLGFDPDGMCLKICRSARLIGSKYPSALAAQLATPKEDRVSLTGVRPGMVAFFDDPNDSNPFGHITTVQSTAATIKTLDDIIVWTNSVKADTLVKVRASYFPTHWGDKFQFAATSLNGVDLLLPKPAPVVPKMTRLRDAVASLKILRDYHAKQGHTRWVAALDRDIAELQETIKTFGG